MPIPRSVWTDDDGTGTTGTVLNNSELQKIYNNIDTLGTWLTEPFNASHFNWPVVVGNVGINRYTITGKTLLWAFGIGNSNNTPGGMILNVRLPGGFYAATTTSQPCHMHDGSAWKIASVDTTAGSQYIGLRHIVYSFPAAGPFYVYFVLIFEVI